MNPGSKLVCQFLLGWCDHPIWRTRFFADDQKKLDREPKIICVAPGNCFSNVREYFKTC